MGTAQSAQGEAVERLPEPSQVPTAFDEASGLHVPLAGCQVILGHGREDQRRRGALGRLLGGGVLSVVDGNEHRIGLLARFLEGVGARQSDGVAALNAADPVMQYILAGAACTDAQAETWRGLSILVEEDLLGLPVQERDRVDRVLGELALHRNIPSLGPLSGKQLGSP